MFYDRIRRTQMALKQTDNDFILICDRENLIYYTGITEIECGALIIEPEGIPTLVTLWLDIPFFKQKIDYPIVGYIFGKETLGSKVCDLLKKKGYKDPKILFSKYFIEVGVYESLRKNFQNMTVANGTEFFYKIRSIKDKTELDYIRKASDIVVKGMESVVDAIQPGMTESEVLGIAEMSMRKAGSEGHPFRMQVLNEERQAMVHPHALDTTLHNNQYVVVLIGACYKGYVSKITRSIALGKVSPEKEDTYHLMHQAQKAAIAASKPGTPVQEVYHAAYRVIDEAGYGKHLIDAIGYGIGIRQSEFYPVINKNGSHVLEKGMAVDMIFPTLYHPVKAGPRILDVVFVDDEPEVVTQFEDFPKK
ncbi:MAG: aminopeptidase P family protein [Eubacteriaceae bacterium]|nr:aminopeptidase P family protein [Eubacteriaceae bacterium]